MVLSRLMFVAAMVAIAGCDAADIGGAGAEVVASAAGHELRIEEAARLLAAAEVETPDAPMAGALAERWVDYILLATAMVQDPTLARLDLEAAVAEQKEELLLTRYLEARVRPAAALTDADLDRLWIEEGPGEEVRARHILLRVDDAATPAGQRQARSRADAVRARALAGEDFAALALAMSDDPDSKESGGDLGWFGRGRMVPAFEEAAFKLRPGALSPIVETPFGYHVIKVEERRRQPIGENREIFRQAMVGKTRQDAVAAFVAEERKRAALAVEPGAAAGVRALASGNDARLRGGAASRRLAAFRGGELTAGDVAKAMQAVPAEAREQVKTATAAQITEFLEAQALRKYLLAEAGRTGIRVPVAEMDALRGGARAAVRAMLQTSGLTERLSSTTRPGKAAVRDAVDALMKEAVAGQRQLPPLGALGAALRDAYGAEVDGASFQRVADRVKVIRASPPAAQ